MAETNKTEKATPKKRRDERKKGNAFQSKDIISIVVIIVGFTLLNAMGRYTAAKIKALFITQMNRMEHYYDLNSTICMEVFRDAALTFVVTALPMAIALAATGIIMTGVQTRFLVSADLLKFKFSRISFIQGMKRLMSLRSVVQLVKSILKIIVIFWIIYASAKDMFLVAPDILTAGIASSLDYMLSKIMAMVFKICLLFVGVAVLDLAYQKYDYEKKLRMTKQEIKDEYKQTEGDPFIKSRIKEKQRKMSLNRMIQQVPTADVIVRNPTHFAVALKYDINNDFAPMVVAKGQDLLARRIIDVAERNNVLITEDKPLARSLYHNVEVNDYIPSEFYQAVAEVLAWVYSMREKDKH